MASMLVLAFVLTSVLLVRARAAERKADKTVDQLTAANEFVIDIFENVDPYRDGGNVPGIALLERASDRIDRAYVDQPEVEASARMILGRSLLRLGFPEKARLHIQAAYQTRHDLLGEADADTLDALRQLAFVDVALANYDEAESAYRTCLAHSQASHGEQDEKTLVIASGLAMTLAKKGELKQARALFEKTLAAQEAILGPAHAETVATRNNFANLLNDLSLFAKAEQLHRQNLSIRRDFHGDYDPGTLSTMHNLAHALDHRQGKDAEAEALARQALERRQTVLGWDHPDTIMTLNNLATTLGRKQPGEAVSLLREVLTKLDEPQKQHPSVMLAMHSYGHFLMETREFDEAEEVLRQTLNAREQVLGPKHKSTLTTKVTLAENLQALGRLEEATALFREVVDHSERASSEMAALYRGLLGSCLTKMGRYEEASSLLQDSHQSLKAAGSSWTTMIEQFLNDLETTQMREND